ncbi:LOW QUALITY PROTEIN: probable pectinesterase/pectinesterase inhibitor 25 [Asparagus officinalis]|uniref:LOW QUALITY PROTEIN: probable pectinesterase/pectinesterase inhibitor 25 n=1 Tax=Asparagus officinalis TaxID=4686 RepID=UPI00098E7BD1|nr:LOW QUALITY PROTEIN: probable pectinesterase/pectinesterase inhibitor 25 [Asparagus officinalis]
MIKIPSISMLPLSFQYRPRVAMPSISLSLLFLLTRFAATATSSESTSAACKVLRATPSSAAPSSPLEITVPPYDYGRYSVKQALKQPSAAAKIIGSYLTKGRDTDAGPTFAVGALDDCRQLAGLNADFLIAVQLKVLVLVLLERGKDFLLSVVSGVEIIKADFQGPAKFGRNLLEGNASVVPLSQPVIVVARDGTGNFTTINDAVAFVPNGTSSDDGYIAIFIRPGVYEENVIVAKSKRNLIMIGAGIDQTVITGNRSVFDGWTTYNSATFAVHGERFIAINITFENTAGPEKHQAVALRNSADLSSFYRCKFVGYQDTLYAHSLRQFYRDCEIKGTVDFIFGNAASVFQHCTIIARKPLPNQFIAITAQGRAHPNQTTGISIHNCTILAESELNDLKSSTKSYLGRPWKEYSRTVYMQSYINGFIDPKGWIEWNGTEFALGTLFYGEFDNYGPGSDTSGRVQWTGYTKMNKTQAAEFTVANFTAGDAWLPAIPYDQGLL